MGPAEAVSAASSREDYPLLHQHSAGEHREGGKEGEREVREGGREVREGGGRED